MTIERTSSIRTMTRTTSRVAMTARTPSSHSLTQVETVQFAVWEYHVVTPVFQQKKLATWVQAPPPVVQIARVIATIAHVVTDHRFN